MEDRCLGDLEKHVMITSFKVGLFWTQHPSLSTANSESSQPKPQNLLAYRFCCIAPRSEDTNVPILILVLVLVLVLILKLMI